MSELVRYQWYVICLFFMKMKQNIWLFHGIIVHLQSDLGRLGLKGLVFKRESGANPGQCPLL